MKLTKKGEAILRHLAHIWNGRAPDKNEENCFIIRGKWLKQAAEIITALDARPQPPASPADFDEGGPMGEPYYQE